MQSTPLILLVACLALGACGSTGTASGADAANAERSPTGAELAPFPYTAEAIRARCVEGVAFDFRIARRGEPVEVQRMRFHAWSEDAVNVELRREREDGTPLAKLADSRLTWTELRSHASFPAARTVRVRGVVVTRLGEWACWQYVVATVDGGTMRYWFADQLPGPPIRVDHERDGERVMRMELVAIHLPDAD